MYIKNIIIIFTAHIIYYIHEKTGIIFQVLLGKFWQELISLKLSEKWFCKHILPRISINNISTSTYLGLRKKGFTVPPSFKQLIKSSRQKNNESKLIQWKLNNKQQGKLFAKKLSFKIPITYYNSVPFEKIKIRNNIVIKPSSGSGSTGVFMCYDNQIRDIKNGEVIESRYEFSNRVNKLISEGVVKNEWIVEQLIYNDKINTITDLKFYTFYGYVYMVQEIIRNPEVRHCFWDRDNNIINVKGFYEDKLFLGAGFNQSDIIAVEELSLQIPCPFLRIDFLSDGSQLVFGEFTPSPGGHSKFDNTIDRILGLEYLNAEERLFNDLLNGKTFSLANKLLSD